MKKAIRILFIIINTLLVILLLGSSVAVAVPPSKFIWFSMLSYAFLPLAVINAFCVLLWLFFKRWEFLISTIALVLRFTMIPLFIQIGGTSSPKESEVRSQAEELKVMTYNVHQFSGKNYEKELSIENSKKFLDIVKDELPDVICVQELFETNEVSIADSMELYGYKYRYSNNKDSKGHPYGVAIYSRWEMQYVHTIDKEGLKIYADIKKDGLTARVVCVHMSSYHLRNEDYVDFAELNNKEVGKQKTYNLLQKVKANVLSHEKEWNEELKAIVNDSPYPIVVAGDFNDTPASYLSGKMRKTMKDSFVEKGSGLGITYKGLSPTYRIDYIYHSKNLNTLAYRTLKSDISDHNGVMAVFTK